MVELGSQRTWMGYFETCVRYIMNARQNITLTEIYDIAKNVSTEGGETIMTIAEQLIKEGMEKGRQEGIEKGIEKGRINILVKQLTKKLGELPSHIEGQLHKASPDIIDRLAEDIFEVESLADVEKLLR